MDNNIKKESPSLSDENLQELSETNRRFPIKKTIVDDRTSDKKYYGKLEIDDKNEYNKIFNRRSSYPWEEDVLKEQKYSNEEIKKIKTVYENKKEVEKITLTKPVLVKAAPKYKGYGNVYQQYTNSTNTYEGEPVSYNYGKHDYYTTSYPNGWPILPKTEAGKGSGRLASDKIPGINALIESEKTVLLLYYNLFYDLHKTVEPLKTTSCFNYRKIRGYENVPNRWSTHASGTAIDFNPGKHPLGVANTFRPEQRLQIRKLIKKYGMQWGGNWKDRPDDMHFEIAVSPAVASQIIQSLNLEKRAQDIKSGINVPVN